MPVESATKEKIKLQQVLQNLISNGIKYNDKPEGIIQISSRENGSYFHFSVKDNGKGLPAPPLRRSGLGLSSIAERVRMLGGSYVLESSPGEGATLSIRIPEPSREGAA